MRHRYQMLFVLPFLLGIGLVGCKKKPKADAEKSPEAMTAGMDQAIAAGMDPAKDRARKATPRVKEPAMEPTMEPAMEAPMGAEPAPAGMVTSGTVTFKKVLPKPGLTRTAIENMSMSFKLTVQGKSIEVSNVGAKNKTEKLLAARGSMPTKLEVTYHKIVKVEVQNGKTRNKPSPLQGKTYVVEAKGGKVTVTTPDGKPAPALEAKLVIKDHKSLGKPNFMLDALPTTPLKIGTRVAAMEAAMKKSFAESMGGSPKEQWTISPPTVTLSGKGQVAGADVAFLTFSMAMTMAQPGGFSMTMTMKGTVTIRLADGWPLRMSMSGPLDIMGQKGAGQMTMSQRYQYK